MAVLDRFLAARHEQRQALPGLVERWQRRVPRSMHPCGQQVCHDYLAAMRRAIDNPSEVERNVRMLRQRIADELRWSAQTAASGGRHQYAYRLRRQADRFEANHHV